MATLLVLGSKPDPCLPPLSAVDGVACANGSGFSAARHGLPTPTYTVMSAILATTASGRHTLEALRGLSSDTVYFSPRPTRGGTPLKRLSRAIREFRARPVFLRRLLRQAGFSYRHFVVRKPLDNRRLLDEFCGFDPALVTLTRTKQPSTGVLCLLMGLASGQYDRFILSGFSFELTHAYGLNPEIIQRGTQASRHADTDIAVLRALAGRIGRLFTTELRVHQATGIPLLAEVSASVPSLDLSSC